MYTEILWERRISWIKMDEFGENISAFFSSSLLNSKRSECQIYASTTSATIINIMIIVSWHLYRPSSSFSLPSNATRKSHPISTHVSNINTYFQIFKTGRKVGQ
jgi:hypothetical protein